jgi:hypothetical protein
MSFGSMSGGEDFSWRDKGRGVWTKVEEELCMGGLLVHVSTMLYDTTWLSFTWMRANRTMKSATFTLWIGFHAAPRIMKIIPTMRKPMY